MDEFKANRRLTICEQDNEDLRQQLSAALKAKEEAAAALEAVHADKMQWVDQATKDHDILYSAGIVEIAARNASVAEYCKHWEGRAERAEKALEEAQRLYHELLYAVGNKYPGETRHETALRYIRNAENQCHGPDAAMKGDA